MSRQEAESLARFLRHYQKDFEPELLPLGESAWIFLTNLRHGNNPPPINNTVTSYLESAEAQNIAVPPSLKQALCAWIQAEQAQKETEQREHREHVNTDSISVFGEHSVNTVNTVNEFTTGFTVEPASPSAK